ncbi:MAG: hypothetical protein M1838_000509 [Thelocarpon superellum]|nr:MAG: hypothetical protein M1838_000509 [Thelocarpon superellum]
MSALITTSQPAMQPPAGVTSNFDHPVTQAKVEIIASVLCPFFALLFVAMRMASKSMTRSIGWDDYFSCAAMAKVTSIAYSISLIVRIQFGFTRHLWDVPLTSFVPYLLQYILATAILYGFVLLFAKLSILFLYLRLFQVHRLFIYLSYGLIFVVMGYLLSSIGVAIFQCAPVEKAWNPAVPGHCMQIQNLAIFSAVMNVITDFAIFLLPLPLVWGLRMAPRAKVGLLMVFLAGAFVCVVSIVRLQATISISGEKDITWTWVKWDIASLMEGNVGIICGSLPAIKPLVQRFLPSILPPSIVGSDRSKNASPTFPPSNSREGAHSRMDIGTYYPLSEPKKSKMPFIGTRFFRTADDDVESARKQFQRNSGGSIRDYTISYPKQMTQPVLSPSSRSFAKSIGVAVSSPGGKF